MKKTITAMANEVRAELFAELFEMLGDRDPTQTETSTLTIQVVLENGDERFASVQVKLHKADFDLDEKTFEFTEKQNDQKRKADEAAKKKADKIAKQEAAKLKREAEKAAKETEPKAE